LRWDFVWQRPQHVISRLARDREVVFVEEPRFEAGAGAPAGARFALREADGVTVAQPVCADPGPGGGPALDAMYARLTDELVRARGLGGFTAWFYTPMLLPAVSRRAPGLVVYDAMDELALFRGAPADLLPRERRLLERADVVFTGGVSLGRAKARLHPNVYAFPSGVEVEHYRRALDPRTAVPADLAAVPGPRVGFFGVLDERLDLPLLAAAAAARPDLHFVLLGPVVKIGAAALPRRPNLHYLGQKAYRDLPAYVKGFDVCMMPFALNAATRFISPTKTLEYMAAHKPIVSTPVADVVGQYAGAVRIAPDATAFVREVQAALDEPAAAREARVIAERRILAQSSWDHIAAQMDGRMDDARRSRDPVPMPALRLPRPVRAASPEAAPAPGMRAAEAAGG
jgi:UDP-galactopyranose mutase